jgi:hypothetical protein
MSRYKFAPKLYQATDWPHLYFILYIFNPATLRGKNGLKLAAGMEQQLFLPFSPVSLV